MHELDDIALWRQYTELNSEEAFAALVTRHINKVYSVALRHTRNPHQAEEITQAVFVILAKKSHSLGKGVVLSGWLYQTSRLTAVTFTRSEIRRSRREQEAHMQTLLNEEESDVWPQIAPLLDAAMAGLNETDRLAVVLRFFDGKSMREVGATLGTNEDAAKKRVNRAVEKLRNFFTQRGVVLPAAILTAAISSNSVQAAPAVLAKSITAVALTKGVAASGSTLTLIKGAMKVMAWAKAKTAIFVGVGVLLAAGTATVTVHQIQAHNQNADESWRAMKDFSSSMLDRRPPQVSILPTKFHWIAGNAGIGAHGNGNRWAGLGQTASDLIWVAYGNTNLPRTRIVFATAEPPDRYDFIYTLPQVSMEGLQQEVKKKLGLIGKREMRDTEVLILAVKRPNMPGLKPANPRDTSYEWNPRACFQNAI